MEEFCDMDFINPSNFYIRNCLDQYIFILTRDRAKAQEVVDKEYGKGHYPVKCLNVSKGNSNYTCVGTATRKK